MAAAYRSSPEPPAPPRRRAAQELLRENVDRIDGTVYWWATAPIRFHADDFWYPEAVAEEPSSGTTYSAHSGSRSWSSTTGRGRHRVREPGCRTDRSRGGLPRQVWLTAKSQCSWCHFPERASTCFAWHCCQAKGMCF